MKSKSVGYSTKLFFNLLLLLLFVLLVTLSFKADSATAGSGSVQVQTNPSAVTDARRNP